MINVTDIEQAITIVKQFASNANEPSLTPLLENSKGSLGYRPYYVAAVFLLLNYRNIVKADEVTFQYNTLQTIKGLLAMQEKFDLNSVIPEGFLCSDLLTELSTIEDSESASGLPSMFVL